MTEQNQQIKIIDRVRLTKDGLFVKGTKQEIHLQQGSLDGACAVYSLIMNLMIIKVIKRKDVVDLDYHHDGRTSKGRLVKVFFENNGLIRKGYWFKKLQKDLNSAYKKRVFANCYFLPSFAHEICNDIPELDPSEIKASIVDEILDTLDKDLPVEIGFTRKGGKSGHAIITIGYQESQNNVSLFCLDPGYPLTKGQIWNNILQIDMNSTSKYNCINFQEHTQVCIDEILIVTPKR